MSRYVYYLILLILGITLLFKPGNAPFVALVDGFFNFTAMVVIVFGAMYIDMAEFAETGVLTIIPLNGSMLIGALLSGVAGYFGLKDSIAYISERYPDGLGKQYGMDAAIDPKDGK